MIAKIIISVFFLAYLVSCSQTKSESEGQDNVKSKESIRLDGLEVYNPFQVKDYSNPKYNITTYLNAFCPTCLDYFDKWNKLSGELQKDSCAVRIVCYSDDDFEYFKYLCGKGKITAFRYPLLLDTSSVFGKVNEKVLNEANGRTVLTDRNDIVLGTGNPILNDDVLEEYIDIITGKGDY